MRVRNFVLLFVMLFVAAPLFADRIQGAEQMSDVELLARFDPVSIADYRGVLADYLRMQSEIIAASGRSELATAMASRTETIQRMSDADIARMMAAGIDLSALHEKTVKFHASVFDRPHRTPEANTSGLPEAPYSFCGSNRRDSAAMMAGQVVLDEAKAVWSGLSRVCDEVIAGFNTSLACIPVDIVLYTAETAYNAFVFCDDEVDSAEIEGSYDRIGHVHGDIEGVVANDDANTNSIINNDDGNMTSIVNNDNSNMTSIVNNDNANTLSIVTNDNANREAIIANANANHAEMLDITEELRLLELRMHIEENLQAGDGKQLAIFMLPAVQGGYLEMTKALVVRLMDDVIAAGGDIHEARNKYREAEAKFALGDWKYGYKKLQEAYGELAKH